MNLYTCFQFSDPEKPLFRRFESSDISYGQVDAIIAQYCNWFASIGLQPGDRLVQILPKSLQGLYLYLASLRYGLIYVPLNPSFTDYELEYFLEDAQPSLVVCEIDRLAALAELADSMGLSAQVVCLDDQRPDSIHHTINQCACEFETQSVGVDTIACILYTSGTTGKPKGAMLSHGNLLANGKRLSQFWQFSEQDTLLHILPIFHCHGLFFACHCILLSGASMIFLPQFDVDNVIDYLPWTSVVMGVPTHYTRLLADGRFDQDLTQSIRLFTSGSAPLQTTTFEAFEERTGQRILERYGMTETGINISNPVDGERKPGTVGLPLPDVDIRLVDDSNQPVSEGQIGYIQVKGPNVFQGYWQKHDKTQQVFTDDGYFCTGDLARQAVESGYISIVGRAKDMIISGGMNIYPAEVEYVINQLPQIHESAVIGLSHHDWGEIVVAVVVLKDGSQLNENDLIDHVKQHLASYKAPKAAYFRDTLPRNAMGKVQKHHLRQAYDSSNS